MTDQYLHEVKLSSRQVFKGQFLQSFQDTVKLPDGNAAIREYIVHPGAVMVIPIFHDENGNCCVVLERQFRYPLDRVMVEFPAGKLDAGEETFSCARRELREETGYVAKQWSRAGILHTAIAYSTEFIEIWFARQLEAGERSLDAGEFLDVFTATSDELVQWCMNGIVTDAKTLTGTLWLQNVLSGAWSLDWRSVETSENWCE